MARDGSGSYTLPSGNPVVSGQTISSTWANDTMTDLETEMTASLDRNGKGGMLAVLKGIDGVVGGPAYSFTNEATTGIYRAGSNDLRVSIAGVDRAKVNGSGIAADTISELTAANGVVIDSVTLKDGGITAAGAIDFTGATVTGFTSTGIDDNATSTAITIDSSDNVGLGLTPQAGGDGANPTLQVLDDAELILASATATDEPHLRFSRSRGALGGSEAIVQSGDNLGWIGAYGYDGTDFAIGAAGIFFGVDNGTTPAANAIAGVMKFYTTPDGSPTLTERMSINNDGTVSVGTTDSPNYLTQLNWGGLQVQHNTAYKASVYLEGYETSVGNAAEFYMKKSRGTQASPATVVDGDSIAYHTFGGQTGATTASNAAAVHCNVDGTPSVGNVPGRLSWWTATDGGGNPTEKMRLNNAGELLIGTTTAGAAKLVVNDDSIQINTSKTPSSATDTGTTGQVAWDGSYIYVCIGTNQWRRAAISGGW